jgi:hypothetical protein
VEFLLWTIFGVAMVLLVVWVAREWAPFWPGGPRSRVRRSSRQMPGVVPAVVAKTERDDRPEFQRHAEAGRYEEAVHSLLLALQWEVGKRRKSPFPRSLTSREILRRSGLEAEAADAFGRVVTVVEASQFGGEAVGAPHYEECAGHYRTVLAGLPGGAR